MNFVNHPIDFIGPLLEKVGAEFNFSKYIYTPDSLLDHRDCFCVSGEQVNRDWLNRSIESLRKDQELAIHSCVKISGRNYHIPMVDFSIDGDMHLSVFDRMSMYLPKSLMLNMAFYNSGRSYHAYSTTLLSPKEWLEFMGRLLLINPRGGVDIIDTRWVGHRIIGGYGSLRWSNNSGLYKGYPQRIAFPVG